MTPSTTTACDPPVYDASVLQAMFGNDAAVIYSVLATFLSSTRNNLADLQLAAAAQNMVNTGALAHKILGACQMSGAQAMGHTALALEQAAKRNDTAALVHGMTRLHTEWALLQTAIAHQMRTTGP